MPMNMTEIFRTRDLILFAKGDNYTAVPGPIMRSTGWRGGQAVRWVTGVNDEITVELSDGRYGAVILYGSDELADMHTGMSGSQITAKWITTAPGGSLISTSSYEKYTWASRQAGPLVPLVYTYNQILYFSLNGNWTNEDEATLSGAAWAPNFFTGFVAQVPKALNNFFLGVQTDL